MQKFGASSCNKMAKFAKNMHKILLKLAFFVKTIEMPNLLCYNGCPIKAHGFCAKFLQSSLDIEENNNEF